MNIETRIRALEESLPKEIVLLLDDNSEIRHPGPALQFYASALEAIQRDPAERARYARVVSGTGCGNLWQVLYCAAIGPNEGRQVMSTVRVHGRALGAIRHDFTKPQADNPQLQLLEVQQRIRVLTSEHQNAKEVLRLALESDDDDRDFNALKVIVTRKARELAEAEEQAAALENVLTQQKLAELPQVIADLRVARKQFAELHRDASIALGRCAELSAKAIGLLNLETRMTGTATAGMIPYSPHRTEVAELAACPRPDISGASFTHIGFDWSVQVIPTRGTEEK